MHPDTSGSGELDAARAALRLRQGHGARYDAANAPALELGWARRGSAYFARKLNELSDDELAGPSLVAGWTRRHVAAWIGYQARALARLVERARTGADLHMFDRPEQRAEEIADGATLPTGALRHLVTHAEIHLNVEWRELLDRDWDSPLNGHDDEPATARQTGWIRAREIWLQALALGNGGTLRDAPADFLRALIGERLQQLNDLDPALNASARYGAGVSLTVAGHEVSAPAPAIAHWLCGYDARLESRPNTFVQQRIDALGPSVLTANTDISAKELHDV